MIDWAKIFDDFAEKTVTPTDKNKGAYVPNTAQCRVIAKAGITPSVTRPAHEFEITVLDDTVRHVGASFYHSQRLTDRSVEPRMGHAFISAWLKIGDTVLLGSIGNELFAVKLNAFTLTQEDLDIRVADRARPETIMRRARLAKGKPRRRVVVRDDFVRDAFVVTAALIRSGNRCEMPGCESRLFERDNGKSYVEVHHVIPLGEDGEDSLANAAALCPHCHREQHFGRDRAVKRGILKTYIDGLPK